MSNPETPTLPTIKVTDVKLTPAQVRKVDAMFRTYQELSQVVTETSRRYADAQREHEKCTDSISAELKGIVGETFDSSELWLTRVEGEDVILYTTNGKTG